MCLPIDKHIFGPILDDHILEYVVRRVPHGAQVNVLIDACTSIGLCDLLFQYTLKRGENGARMSYGTGGSQEAAEPPRYDCKAADRVGKTVLYTGRTNKENATDIAIAEQISSGAITRSPIKSMNTKCRMQAHGFCDENSSFGELVAMMQSIVHDLTRAEPTLVGEKPQESHLSSSNIMDVSSTRFSLYQTCECSSLVGERKWVFPPEKHANERRPRRNIKFSILQKTRRRSSPS